MTAPLHKRDAHAEWARCKDWIAGALGYTGEAHSIEDVEAGIASGLYHFWPGSKSAAITTIHQFPRARFLHVFLAGGDLEELKNMVPDFVSWGRFNGCKGVTLTGRKGWERALKSQGWKANAVALALPIEPLPKAQGE